MMKTLARKISLPLLFVFIIVGAASAQPGWNWGEQVDIAKEKNALYTDFVKLGKYKEAIPPHSWLLENTPDLNASIYINGATIYEELAEAETDDAKKSEYQAKALEMYDLRIKYFGKEAYVLNRKVFPAYKFYKNDKSKYQELYEMYQKAFKLNGENFYDNNLVAYMDVVRRYKVTGGAISDEEVIDIYTQITDVIDAKKATGKNVSRLEKITDTVDKMLTSAVDLDCDMVEDKLGPKLTPDDIKMAKKIFQLMLTGKCTDRPLAFEAAQIVNEKEPSFGIAKFLGIRAAQDGNIAQASEYYQEAIDLTDENTKKAEVYLNIAKLHYSNGNKVEARSNSRKALAFDPSLSDAYSLVGDMYMSSFEDCKGGEKKTEDYAIFIAAYNQYKRAGDSAGMSKAKALFPSIEDIFNDGYEEGQTIQVGCWINESVVLERRPSN
jgi:tetratricopeptide (TPR) repeat protein